MAVALLAGDRRPGLHAALHAEPVARNRRSFSGREAKFGTIAIVSGIMVLASSPPSTTWGAPQQAVGSDGGQAVHAVGSDAEGARRPAEAGEHQGLRAAERLRAVPRSARPVSMRVEAGQRRIHRRREEPVAREPVSGAAARNRGLRVRRPHRTGHVRRRAGAHQRTDQGHLGASSTRSTSSRATARRRPMGPTARATASSRRRSDRELHRRQAGIAQQKDVPDASVLVVAGPKTDFFAPRWTC